MAIGNCVSPTVAEALFQEIFKAARLKYTPCWETEDEFERLKTKAVTEGWRYCGESAQMDHKLVCRNGVNMHTFTPMKTTNK